MGFQIATAQPNDTRACTNILITWVRENDWMPELWTIKQTTEFVADLIQRRTVHVLQDRDRHVVGFLDLHNGWVNCLYLADHARRQGQGKALIHHAARLHPTGLHLWCFAQNQAAIRFYTHLGFRDVARTDGDNDERLPDIQFYRPGEGTS